MPILRKVLLPIADFYPKKLSDGYPDVVMALLGKGHIIIGRI